MNRREFIASVSALLVTIRGARDFREAIETHRPQDTAKRAWWIKNIGTGKAYLKRSGILIAILMPGEWLAIETRKGQELLCTGNGAELQVVTDDHE